jgi:hypothetical protein
MLSKLVLFGKDGIIFVKKKVLNAYEAAVVATTPEKKELII